MEFPKEATLATAPFTQRGGNNYLAVLEWLVWSYNKGKASIYPDTSRMLSTSCLNQSKRQQLTICDIEKARWPQL